MEERAGGLWSPWRQLLGRGWNRHSLLSFSLQIGFSTSLCCGLWDLGFGFSGLLVEERLFTI